MVSGLKPPCRLGLQNMPTAPLLRGKTRPNEATCWLWVATCKALGLNPGGWAVIDPATEWSMACNTSLWPLLGVMGGQIGPDPINRLVLTCPSTYVCFFSWSYHTICSCGTIRSTFAELFLALYSICATRWGLRVNWGRTYDCCEIVV